MDGDGGIGLTVPVAPPKMDISHLMAATGDDYTIKKKQKNDGILCCGVTYCCWLWIAFMIASLALILAFIPLILYINIHGIDISGTNSSGSDKMKDDLIYYYYHYNIHEIKPDFNFIFDDLLIEAESWGHNFTKDWYIGTTYRGWEYRGTWDFKYNFNDEDDDGNYGGWAAGNNQDRLYTLSDIQYVFCVFSLKQCQPYFCI